MLNQIKVLLLSFIGLFRRALCCFSRRRKTSLSESESLQCVNVVAADNNYHLKKSNQGQERDWNSWDDAPRTVEEHIEQYRQKIAKPPTPKDEEPEPDFFSEMAPKIKPQLKVYLGQDKEQDKRDFSRLEAKSDVPITVNADLEDWEEEDPGGWEELDTETTKKLIREKRKELRHQKNANQKSKNNGIANDSPRHENFAARIGSRQT
ncbi:uncharacterized protein LOC129912143 [Episyrphus balteatus]|uniref:uncharacterized protein LOC129912143 n=1 Tax=Episyrphus balteatus TaxID=286459 RepID=UPI002484F988|nr:uncharacterized protein LOC129912143 [Episyrphus balteatus]